MQEQDFRVKCTDCWCVSDPGLLPQQRVTPFLLGTGCNWMTQQSISEIRLLKKHLKPRQWFMTHMMLAATSRRYETDDCNVLNLCKSATKMPWSHLWGNREPVRGCRELEIMMILDLSDSKASDHRFLWSMLIIMTKLRLQWHIETNSSQGHLVA